MIELGATDLLVPGILPIGCFPLYLTLYNSSKKSAYNARTGCSLRVHWTGVWAKPDNLSWLEPSALDVVPNLV